MESETRNFLATFYINGRETLWRIGWGLGEPVYYAVEDSVEFIKDQRVCAELMRGLMDSISEGNSPDRHYK